MSTTEKRPQVKSNNLEPSFGIRLQGRLRTQRKQRQVKERQTSTEKPWGKKEYTEQYQDRKAVKCDEICAKNEET
jgi:hypothetical protein